MKLSVCIFTAFIGICQAATTPIHRECMSDADCTVDECCYKHPEFLIVSKKRQALIPDQDRAHTKGVCQSYYREGDKCEWFDKSNGICSCNEKKGLTCELSTMDPTYSPIPMINYATYRCSKAPQAASKN